MGTENTQARDKMMNLPFLQHFDSDQLVETSSNSLDSFRKGEKSIFSILKLVLFGALGYLSWVYILPPLFMALGRVIAAVGSIILVAFFVLLAPVIFKVLRRTTRKLHEAAIIHDPLGELYDYRAKMSANIRDFVLSQGTIAKLGRDTEDEARKSEELAKLLQGKIVGTKKKIDVLKVRQEELKGLPHGKTEPEYIQNYASLIKLTASVQRDMSQKDQQVDFTRKYGIRGNTIQKLSNKLVLVGAQLDIKALDFDATIDILKRELAFAESARSSTQIAKDALKSTDGWEISLAIDTMTSRIAQDLAMTSANIKDINSFTTLYDVDDDQLYLKLDALAEDIETGKDVIPSANDYRNPDYKMTREDAPHAGGFGDMY